MLLIGEEAETEEVVTPAQGSGSNSLAAWRPGDQMPLPSPWWGSQLPLAQAGCLGMALAGIWPVMCTFLDSASLLFLRDEERLGPRKGLTDFFFFFFLSFI